MKRLTERDRLHPGEKITFLDKTGEGCHLAVHKEVYSVRAVTYERGDPPMVVAVSVETGTVIVAYTHRFGRRGAMPEENE